MSVDTLVKQIERCLETEMYYLALIATLSIPDICGAICSDDGKASGPKYKAWYEKWMRPVFYENMRSLYASLGLNSSSIQANPLDGSSCYIYRCSILHQARSTHEKLSFSRIMFIEPHSISSSIHYTKANDALIIDLPTFCGEMITAYRNWVFSEKNTENYLENTKKSVARHSEGMYPYLVGVPVIS